MTHQQVLVSFAHINNNCLLSLDAHITRLPLRQKVILRSKLQGSG